MATNLVIGTAAELAEHFTSQRSQGIERFYVWFVDFAPVASLHRFSEVIAAVGVDGQPHFRSRLLWAIGLVIDRGSIYRLTLYRQQIQ